MRHILVGAAAACCWAATPAAAEPAAEISAEVEYQEGDYGTGASVETVVARTGVRFESGRFILYGAIPYQRIEAPGNVVAGSGPLGLPIIIDPNQPTTRESREGLGDVRIGAGYRLPSIGGLNAAAVAEVKLPTASARRGLGTGATDVTVGLEASRPVGAITPYVSATYTVPGDPEGYRLRDSLGLRGGFAARLSPGLRGTIEYGYARSLSPLVPSEQQVASGLDIGLSQRLSLGLQATAGLSDGAADLGAGIRLGWRIF
jgi:hypothetical protein